MDYADQRLEANSGDMQLYVHALQIAMLTIKLWAQNIFFCVGGGLIINIIAW